MLRQLFFFCLLLCTSLTTTLLAAEKTTRIEIPAWSFERGVAKTFTTSYASGGPVIAFGGTSPWWVEFDVPVPEAGSYELQISYAAHTTRPLTLSVNGKEIKDVCGKTTGSWDSKSAKWESCGNLTLQKGKNILRLAAPGEQPPPHLTAVALVSKKPLPANWKLVRPQARKLTSPPPAQPKNSKKPASASAATSEHQMESLKLAIEDLTKTHAADGKYPRGKEFLKRLAVLEEKFDAEAFQKLKQEALLANPLLDFDELLLIKRKGPRNGLTANWQSNSSLRTGFTDAVAILSPVSPEGTLTPIFEGQNGSAVTDVDLHFDAGKMQFSMKNDAGYWNVFETLLEKKEGKTRVKPDSLRQITPSESGVHNYDSCYLPDGRTIFTSTAPMIGVPCVYGSSHVTNTYICNDDSTGMRRLTYDQEHNWSPCVLPNGTILYQRWEYADLPHSNSRMLFTMNPDGTNQLAYYGSNSFWPNSLFYARPVPGSSTKFAGIVTGHHGVARQGELVLFDVAQGRHEADGAVQRIPGRGQEVEPIIADRLTSGSWPKFLHPYPLSEKYFLASMQPRGGRIGIYLVDVFDNLLLIKEDPSFALMEPLPLRKTKTPPIVPDKVRLDSKEAQVYIADVYNGPGLAGIPLGTVKKIRINTYAFSFQGIGGLLGVVGVDGPWDIRRVLGTVPVEADGSALFTVPANLPIAFQPLDEKGRTLQIMRSWTTAMPGELLQCNGCHESRDSAALPKTTRAIQRPPSTITPWYGPTRGFAYSQEVQPVIDKYCVGCHSGEPQKEGKWKGKVIEPSLRGDVAVTDFKMVTPGNGGYKNAIGKKFSVGYVNLARFVRRSGIESDIHLNTPMEFHFNTTDLGQMLEKGHHGVQLDPEAWDRIQTWVDQNCPFQGSWAGVNPKLATDQNTKRMDLMKKYGGIVDDAEYLPEPAKEKVAFVAPQEVPRPAADAAAQLAKKLGVPSLTAKQAADAQQKLVAKYGSTRKKITLNKNEEDEEQNIEMEFVLIPAGECILGSTTGGVDEFPLSKVTIDKPFWLGTTEVTNAQYACFDPNHDSHYESKQAYQFGVHGYALDKPEQPVVRVSWNEANAFCKWLSEKTKVKAALPSEAQWEYAARAGTQTPFYFGDLNTDFGKHANLADNTIRLFASNPYSIDKPLKNPTKYDDYMPRESRFDDGALVTRAVGQGTPNPWGLQDIYGNVAEWTSTSYHAYPYNAKASGVEKVARGGGWRDRPFRATSSFRVKYPAYQKVFQVGFRVMLEE